VPVVRQGHRRRGAHRGRRRRGGGRRPGRTGGRRLRPDLALLRPALEAALVVARAGERADPPVPAPTSVRRYLTFQRFPERAAEALRRALEDDEAFRRRVRDAVAEAAPPDEGPHATVGEAGWLLLDRPAGAEERLEAMLAE